MKQRLNVNLDPSTTFLNESESFSQDPLEKYQLTDSALTALMNGSSEAMWTSEQIACGLIMDNAAGRSLARSNLSQAKLLLEEIRPYQDDDLKSYQATIELRSGPLNGEVSLVGERHRLFFRAGLLARRHLLGPWIEHLFLQATGYQRPSIIIGRHGKEAKQGQFTEIEQSLAMTILDKLTEHYQLGICTPLLLPAETLYTLYSTFLKTENLNLATQAAQDKWLNERGGDGTDPYWQRLMQIPDDLDQPALDLAKEVFAPMDTHWKDADADQ